MNLCFQLHRNDPVLLCLGMADHPPPPLYSHRDPDATTQLLLVPPAGSVNFQRGYLGAEAEHAAIEGEIQIKDIEPGRWSKVYVCRPKCQPT